MAIDEARLYTDYVFARDYHYRQPGTYDIIEAGDHLINNYLTKAIEINSIESFAAPHDAYTDEWVKLEAVYLPGYDSGDPFWNPSTAEIYFNEKNPPTSDNLYLVNYLQTSSGRPFDAFAPPPIHTSPGNGATVSDATVTLDWSISDLGTDDGWAEADFYTVYLYDTTDSKIILDNIETSNTYYVASIEDAHSYYWRITSYSIYKRGHTSVGNWSFSVSNVPTKAINPAPIDAADDVVLDRATISWEDGGGATSYDVWYGENEAGLTKVSEGQAGLSFTISGIDYGSPFDYVISRTWRIDAINESGTTTGDVWTFTTIVFIPPQVTYELIPGGNGQGPYDDPPGIEGTDWNWTGENNMATIRRLVAAAYNAIWYEA